MSNAARHAPTLSLTSFHKTDHLCAIHPIKLIRKCYGRQTPIHAIHAQILCDNIFLFLKKTHNFAQCFVRDPFKIDEIDLDYEKVMCKN